MLRTVIDVVIPGAFGGVSAGLWGRNMGTRSRYLAAISGLVLVALLAVRVYQCGVHAIVGWLFVAALLPILYLAAPPGHRTLWHK